MQKPNGMPGNQEDEGIQADSSTRPELDRDQDGVVDDALGNPAAPEESGAD